VVGFGASNRILNEPVRAPCLQVETIRTHEGGSVRMVRWATYVPREQPSASDPSLTVNAPLQGVFDCAMSATSVNEPSSPPLHPATSAAASRTGASEIGFLVAARRYAGWVAQSRSPDTAAIERVIVTRGRSSGWSRRGYSGSRLPRFPSRPRVRTHLAFGGTCSASSSPPAGFALPNGLGSPRTDFRNGVEGSLNHPTNRPGARYMESPMRRSALTP
jgi:hypothetical protein